MSVHIRCCFIVNAERIGANLVGFGIAPSASPSSVSPKNSVNDTNLKSVIEDLSRPESTLGSIKQFRHSRTILDGRLGQCSIPDTTALDGNIPVLKNTADHDYRHGSTHIQTSDKEADAGALQKSEPFLRKYDNLLQTTYQVGSDNALQSEPLPKSIPLPEPESEPLALKSTSLSETVKQHERNNATQFLPLECNSLSDTVELDQMENTPWPFPLEPLPLEYESLLDTTYCGQMNNPPRLSLRPETLLSEFNASQLSSFLEPLPLEYESLLETMDPDQTDSASQLPSLSNPNPDALLETTEPDQMNSTSQFSPFFTPLPLEYSSLLQTMDQDQINDAPQLPSLSQPEYDSLLETMKPDQTNNVPQVSLLPGTPSLEYESLVKTLDQDHMENTPLPEPLQLEYESHLKTTDENTLQLHLFTGLERNPFSTANQMDDSFGLS